MARQEDVEAALAHMDRALGKHNCPYCASAFSSLTAELARLSAELDEARRGELKEPTPMEGREDEWVYDEEPVGPTCPFGHPWGIVERAGELEAALRYIEWIHDGSDEPGPEHNVCPACGLTEARGHDRSCRTACALAPATPEEPT